MDFELLLEAERRGILPSDKADLLTEARRRGLVPGAPSAAAPSEVLSEQKEAAPAFQRRPLPSRSGLKPTPARVSPEEKQSIIQTVRPTVEAIGSVAGGAAGTALGPVGTVAGAGLGYGMSKGALDQLERYLGYRPSPESVTEALASGTQDVALGAALETLGMKVIAPAAQAAGRYINRLAAPSIKAEAYGKALQGKEEEVLNLLRQPTMTPGVALSAGEIAAPAGSVGFSVLQKRASEVPALSDEYARMQAQTGQAQAQQAARAQQRFDTAAAKVEQKIASAVKPVPPEEVGEALTAAARSERETMKQNVIQPAYKEAFDLAGSTKIDMSDVVTKAEEILGRKLSQFDASTAPETVRKLSSLQESAAPAKPVGKGIISGRIVAKTPEPPTPTVTLQQLDDIRKAVNADIAAGKVSSDPAAGARLRNLQQIHQVIDDAVAASPLTTEAKNAYKGAIDIYRTEYVPRFKTGVNEQIFRSTGLNEAKIKPEDVIAKYFQPNGVSEARNFVDLFGSNPKAQDIARSGIENLYLREVKKITPEAHAAFMTKYQDPLRVLGDAGIDVTQRLNVIGTNAQRLQRIQDLAKASNIKLTDPLPPGATADAVQQRIDDLTKNLTPRQLADVRAVQADLLRTGEYERLVKMGAQSGVEVRGLGTKTGKELGLPLPSFLSATITVFNNVFKRLALRMDDRVAMEIARELTDPALAAKAIESAVQKRSSIALRQRVAPTVATEAARGLAITGAGYMNRPENMLNPYSSENALAQ